MLALRLTQPPMALIHGDYTVKGQVGKRMPDQLRWCHPDMVEDLRAIAPWAVFSDMLRSAESSLEAVESGRGALPPGYSGHNFALADDLATTESRAKLAEFLRAPKASKKDLDEAMQAAGFYCHRIDHENDHEAWHYNWLGRGVVISPKVESTRGYLEQRVLHYYGAQLAPDDAESQRMLAKLGLYKGAIDGDIGKRSKQAIGVFQRGWHLPATGTLDKRTKRTLALVAADRVETPWPAL